MKEIIYRRQFKNELKQIYEYISQDSIYYSTKTIKEIREKIKILSDFPYMGRKIPEYNNISLREVIYKSYRILYKINHKIYVLNIFHSSRDLLNSLNIFNEQ